MNVHIPFIGSVNLVESIFGLVEGIKLPFFLVWNWLVTFCGGNIIAAALVVGLLFYVTVDLFYHTFIDKPMAVGGSMIMNYAKWVAIFGLILAVVFAGRM